LLALTLHPDKNEKNKDKFLEMMQSYEIIKIYKQERGDKE
jgi:DnaJ-class molecular chaperone